MLQEREPIQPSIDHSLPCRPLRDCVRRALHLRRARLHAVAAAAGLASVATLALGAAFPPVFPLGSLFPDGGGDGSRGFVLTGVNPFDFSGGSLSAAGDVNGDGIGDVIIGAQGAGGHSDVGQSYVVFGSAQGFPAVFPLASLFPGGGGDGSHGFVLTGINGGDYSGFSVAGAGDVNGDGIDDLIVGAMRANSDAGESYVVFGSTQGFPAVLPFAALYPDGGGDGSRGFVLTGIDAYDYAGWSVSAAGDVNGDGTDDLLIGARRADPGGKGNAGESYVVFGSTQGFPAVFPLASLYPDGGGDGSRGFVLTGIDDYDLSGSSVSEAGDINGDGIDDLIIAADTYSGLGESYVVFGSSQGFPAVVPLATLYPVGGGDGSRGFVLIDNDDFTSSSVSAAGDVNGDGVDDVIVGTPFSDHPGRLNEGDSYVVFGSTRGFPALFPLASQYLGGVRGFVLTGIDFDDQSGNSVSAAGDVNGDGVDDLIVGAIGSDSGAVFNAGESYVVFGSTGGFPAVFPFASLYPAGGGDGSRGFVLTGIDRADESGFSSREALHSRR